MVSHMLDLIDEFNSQHSNNQSFRGFDWHGASMINVFKAIDALVQDVPNILSDKEGLVTGDPSQLIYIGKLLVFIAYNWMKLY
jgi:hypothetical protein